MSNKKKKSFLNIDAKNLYFILKGLKMVKNF